MQHRTPNRAPYLRVVLADKGVHHQRHRALAGVARSDQGLAECGNLVGQRLDRLAKQVRQYIEPEGAGARKCRRIAGCGDPNGQLTLHRSRHGEQLHRVAQWIDRFAHRARAGDKLLSYFVAIGLLTEQSPV